MGKLKLNKKPLTRRITLRLPADLGEMLDAAGPRGMSAIVRDALLAQQENETQRRPGASFDVIGGAGVGEDHSGGRVGSH